MSLQTPFAKDGDNTMTSEHTVPAAAEASSIMEELDEQLCHYFGCQAEDLRSGGIAIIAGGNHPLTSGVFSRGAVVVSKLISEASLKSAVSGRRLREILGQEVLTRLISLLPARENPWVVESENVLLYCTRNTFTPQNIFLAKPVPDDDPLWQDWEEDLPGKLDAAYGVYIDGVRVSRATLTRPGPGSEHFRAVGIYTKPEYWGKGYAKACVSAATQHALEHGLVPLYNTQAENAASLAVARAVGYCEYMRTRRASESVQ